MPLLTRLEGFVDVRVPGVFRLLSSPAASDSVGVNRSSGFAGQPSQDPRSPSEVGLPEGQLGLLATLLIVLLMAVGLVALARLVVGEELFETQHRRGHRG